MAKRLETADRSPRRRNAGRSSYAIRGLPTAVTEDSTHPPIDEFNKQSLPSVVATGQAATGDGVHGGEEASVAAESERDLWVGRTDWRHFSGRLAVFAVGNLLLGILIGWATTSVEWLTFWPSFGVVVLVLVVSGVVIVGPVVLTVIGSRYRVTTERLFVERGILSQTIDQMELIRIDDVRLHRTLLDRIFGLGTVKVLSTDATDKEIVIEGISQPEKVAEVMRDRMRKMRKKSLFIENL